MQRLTGKVTAITGGANGIGLAAGQLFADEGAYVLLVDSAAETLNMAVTSIGSDRVSGIVADMTQPDQVEGYVRAAGERYG